MYVNKNNKRPRKNKRILKRTMTSYKITPIFPRAKDLAYKITPIFPRTNDLACKITPIFPRTNDLDLNKNIKLQRCQISMTLTLTYIKMRSTQVTQQLLI